MFPALKNLRKRADDAAAGGKQQGGGGGGGGGEQSKQTFIIAALSNTSIFPDGHEFNDPTTQAGRKTAELRSQFDLFVSSAHVGMRKPDREIYDYTIRELDRLVKGRGDAEGIRAEDIVFLDDIGANLKMARKLGMRTIKVVLEKTDEAVRELEEVMGMKLAGEKLENVGATKAKL